MNIDKEIIIKYVCYCSEVEFANVLRTARAVYWFIFNEKEHTSVTSVDKAVLVFRNHQQHVEKIIEDA